MKQTDCPPYNQTLEEQMIVFLINYPALIKTLPIKSEHFYANNNLKAFETLLEMSNKNEPVDIVTFGMRFHEAGGKIASIRLLFTDGIWRSELHAPWFLRNLAILTARRKIHEAYNDESLAPSDFVERVKRLEMEFIESKPVDISDAFTEFNQAYNEKKKKLEERGAIGLVTGIKSIDRLGLSEGNLVVVAAKPSVGKTSLALTIAVNAASYEQKVLFFSAEMSQEEVMNKICALLTGTSQTKFKHVNADATMALLPSEVSALKGRLKIIDARGMTSSEVVRIAKQEGSADLVVVDYIQYLADPQKKSETNSQRIGMITKRLKWMARDTKCVVIAPSQVSREAKGIPELHHLRESGEIEQDADVVLILHREEKDSTDAQMIVAKNRMGPAGMAVELAFDLPTTRFSDVARKYPHSEVIKKLPIDNPIDKEYN